MIISTTTIIAGAVVFLLAILGSLINPFLRSLRLHTVSEQQGNDTETEEQQAEQKATLSPSVTVLITAHDNLPELERNLPSFLKQKYSNDYQVVVVCQNSDGDTIDFLKRLSAEHTHLYYTFIPDSSRYMSRKKLQITVGVKASKYEWILLTEPTCRANNDEWLAAMTRQCQAPTHLVLGYVCTEDTCKGVRRFDTIREAYYLLRRAQRSYGYRTNLPNVLFRKSDFMNQQGFQGNLEYLRSEYDFLVNKYGQEGGTAVELNEAAWLTQEAPTDKSWHNAHLYLQASRKSMLRHRSMRTLMFFDHLMPHLSLTASLVTLAYAIMTQDWILTACAGFSLLLLIILRVIIAHKAISHFDRDIATYKLPFYEYGVIWRNLANKVRYWHADKNDFTSHKL